VANEIESMKRSLPVHRFQRFLVETYQTEDDLKRAISERVASSMVLAREAKIEIPEAELKQAFEKMPEKTRAARAHCAQIMVPTEDSAAAVMKKLKAKDADFAAIAREHSVAPEAKQGGDLGWFEKGDMPAVFDQVCFTLEPGQISELTPSELGYHVFKVIAREDERPLTFDEAKAGLAEELRADRQRDKEKELIQSLLSQHRVERHEKRIADAIK
jgi:peptidyl-prolyl cis-trans isomerase C